MGAIDYFIPGEETTSLAPLERYAPPPPANVVASYVEAYAQRGSRVVDPFCRSDVTARQALQAGRQYLATTFNPVQLLAVREAVNLPSASSLKAAVAELGDLPKSDKPLREHLLSLYATTCPNCDASITADYFLWDRTEELPTHKGYRCPTCAGSGEAPVDEADLLLVDQMETRGLHYWHLMERMDPPEGERKTAERLLNLYTPRNLQALVTLSMKIEGEFDDSAAQETLRWLLLHCLDAGSKLNSPDGERRPPARLQPPRRFLEANVWTLFQDQARKAERWATLPAPRLADNLELFLESPPPPSLASDGRDGETYEAWVGQISASDLSQALPAESVDTILAAPPDWATTFWTLSYLWTAWLWGKERANDLRPLLGRRSGDWTGYLRGVRGAMNALHTTLSPQGWLIFLVSTRHDAQAEALLLASDAAGFQLERMLFCPQAGPRSEASYQMIFGPRQPPSPEPATEKHLREEVLASAEDVINLRGEPLPIHWLRMAGYSRLASKGLLSHLVEDRSDPLGWVREQVELALRKGLETILTQWGDSSDEKAPFLWWLNEPSSTGPPLSDQVERAIRDILGASPSLTRAALDRAIYPLFPGFLTPEPALVHACLTSHGNQVAPGRWALRDEDHEPLARAERARALANLILTGHSLGFQVWLAPALRDETHGEGPLSLLLPEEDSPWNPHPPCPFDVLWHEGEEATHGFVVSWEARIAGLMLANHEGSVARCYLALPGRRASLAQYKVQRIPLPPDCCWSFVQWEALEQLTARETLTPDDWSTIEGLDFDQREDKDQLKLFEVGS
jgi:hypothetical protein